MPAASVRAMTVGPAGGNSILPQKDSNWGARC